MTEKEPVREVDKKLSEKEAEGLLLGFFEKHGIDKSKIQVFSYRYNEENRLHEFSLLNPYGLFLVRNSGEVEDNYGVLDKPNK